jgi:hypothetical protein
VLDPDGFAVDARPHNQCMPTMAWANGHYYAAWQSWVEGALKGGYGSYEVRGARVGPEGTVKDPGGVSLVEATGLQPSLTFHDEGGLVLFLFGRAGKGSGGQASFPNSLGYVRIDPKTGTPRGKVAYFDGGRHPPDINFVPGVARMNDGSVLLTRRGDLSSVTLHHLDRDMRPSGEVREFRKSAGNRCLALMASLTGNGGRALMTCDFPTEAESIPRRQTMYMKVWGWTIGANGAITDGGKSGFLVAGGGQVDCMQGVPCAGPDGSFLVVYAEVRGVEDTRIVGRVVKTGG